ncbi:MAG TPA: ABC transporter permease [Terriglobales bacterium]|jgi:ABC-2 type transport system permease protein
MARGGSGVIVDKAAAVIRKDFLTAIRYRNGLLFNAFAPVTQLLLFYYLARSVGPQFRPEGMPYFLFLLVGTGFYTFLLTGMHSFFRSIQESQQAGTLEVLMTTSTPAPVLLSLSVLSVFAGGLVQLLLYIGGGLLLFRPALHVSIAGCIAAFTLSLVIVVSVGMIAAGLQIAIHRGSAALWLLGSTAWVISGTLFPVGALPRPIEIAAQLLPMTHSLAAMRLAVTSASSPALMKEIEVLVAFSIVLVPASILFFTWTLRRARQFGTLSFY